MNTTIYPMRKAEWINLIFFSFLGLLAWLAPMGRGRRLNVTAIGMLGIGLIFAAQFSRRLLSALSLSVIRDWLPAPLLLMAYWQGGQFFTQPTEDLQFKLAQLDRKLIGPLLRWLVSIKSHTWINAYFEIAYLFCYPLVPSGLGVLYLMHMGRYADRFWAMVLPPAYICYAILPVFQTLPPRMLEPEWQSGVRLAKVRTLNLWVLRYGSIQVNTFPSAHVAASIAASLALFCLVRPAGWIFLWVSLSIAVGSVLGRYHYAADALFGAVLAAAIFLIERRFFN